MIDVAMGIEVLVPAAEYFGSTTANTKECFDNLNWLDTRTKPTWGQVQSAWIALEPQLTAEANAKAAQKQAVLNRLGLTAEEAQLLLGGN